MKESFSLLTQHYLNLTEFEAEEVISSMDASDAVELQFENRFLKVGYDGYFYSLMFKDGTAVKKFDHYCDLTNYIFNIVDKITGKSKYTIGEIY